jgi:tripartite-type tricarboxylate transporter receptor subunit TctC
MLRLALIAFLAASVTPANAESWPSRPLTMVVPFATGGPMDAVARILQPALSEALHQQVIVERRTGINSCSAMSARTR